MSNLIGAGEESVREALATLSPVLERFGIVLGERDVNYLALRRQESLVATGRVEFRGGILPRLAHAFCDSPFIAPAQFADTLAELQDIFYHYKNATEDRIDDDALVDAMKYWFDGPCQGSLELLCDNWLEGVARDLREGRRPTLPG